MTVKMTGAQFKAFLAAEWGPDAYWEETEITVNGEPMPDDCDDAFVKDADTITITGGVIYQDQVHNPQSCINAEPFARKWLKAQSTVTLMVEVPREHADWFAKSFQATGVNKQMAKVISRIG